MSEELVEEKRPKVRLVAYYLPQYHPIPENDEWWGKGFTEWTNVVKAKPLFNGHYQPRLPADLGFYDLRVPETREAQAAMAKEHGIEAFCYWHYWFNGKRLLERPFNDVLTSGHPDFPFCLAWANQTWSGIWHGAPERILIEQTYPGLDDHMKHFYALLEAFSDNRYLKIDDKPLFLIYRPKFPDSKRVTDLWRELAVKAGLKGLYLVGEEKASWIPQEHGFDASVPHPVNELAGSAEKCHRFRRLKRMYKKLWRLPTLYPYEEILRVRMPGSPPGVERFPCILPNWDNTPRSGRNGLVLCGSTPELFGLHIQQEFSKVDNRNQDRRIIFIKSWNEWAEGNYLEPDMKFGRAYLEVLAREVFRG